MKPFTKRYDLSKEGGYMKPKITMSQINTELIEKIEKMKIDKIVTDRKSTRLNSSH